MSNYIHPLLGLRHNDSDSVAAFLGMQTWAKPGSLLLHGRCKFKPKKWPTWWNHWFSTFYKLSMRTEQSLQFAIQWRKGSTVQLLFPSFSSFTQESPFFRPSCEDGLSDSEHSLGKYNFPRVKTLGTTDFGLANLRSPEEINLAITIRISNFTSSERVWANKDLIKTSSSN